MKARTLCALFPLFVACSNSPAAVDASVVSDGSLADAYSLDAISDAGADTSADAQADVDAQAPADAKADVDAQAPADAKADVIVDAATPTFLSGTYYLEPFGTQRGGTIRELSGKLTLAPTITGIGFDVNPEFIVSTDNASTLRLTSALGVTTTLTVKGLYAMVRPAFSPDGKFVAVQATETAVNPPNPPEYLTIYKVNTTTGDWTKLAPATTTKLSGNELPEWFSDGKRVSFQGIESDCNILRVINLSPLQTLLTINSGGTTGCFQSSAQTGPRFHMTVSSDSKKLLSVGQMQTFDADTGALLSDIRTQVLNELTAAGYAPDTRFSGQGNGGTFPLDGTFASGDKEIIFDGAVSKNGTYGVVLCTIKTDGTGFSILKGPLSVDPSFSNNHNFSQVNPTAKNW